MAVSHEDWDYTIRKWGEWEESVANMRTFKISNAYNAKNAWGKYNRFTGYLREWVEERINGDQHRSFYKQENALCQEDVEIQNAKMTGNWWKKAMKLADGKKVDGLPSLGDMSPENKEKVYTLFLPAYRALKESYAKRTWRDWFTNHSQYTAERDSIKALEGIMRSLTGDSVARFRDRYQEHCTEFVTSDYVAARNLRSQTLMRAELTNNIEEANRAMNAPEYQKDVADMFVNVVSEISQKNHQPVNMGMLKMQIAGDTVDKLKACMKEINEGYRGCHLDDECTNEQARQIAVENIRSLFREALSAVAPLQLPMKDKIAVAQKITDHMMKSSATILKNSENMSDLDGTYLLKNDAQGLTDSLASSGFDKDEISDGIYYLTRERQPISIEMNDGANAKLSEPIVNDDNVLQLNHSQLSQ